MNVRLCPREAQKWLKMKPKCKKWPPKSVQKTPLKGPKMTQNDQKWPIFAPLTYGILPGGVEKRVKMIKLLKSKKWDTGFCMGSQKWQKTLKNNPKKSGPFRHLTPKMCHFCPKTSQKWVKKSQVEKNKPCTKRNPLTFRTGTGQKTSKKWWKSGVFRPFFAFFGL